MFWLTSKMTAVPISGGTRSQMGKKQAMTAAAEAGVTTTPRAILQFWLDFHSHSLVVSYNPCVKNLFTSASFHSCYCYSNNPLFSTSSPFFFCSICILITSVTSPYNLYAGYQIEAFTCTYTLSCFLPALSFFGAGSTVSSGRGTGEPHTFSALGTRVISMIYLPNVPVISLLQIDPDLDN